MFKSKVLLIYIVCLLLLFSACDRKNPAHEDYPLGSTCQESWIADFDLKFIFPNTGPLSFGFDDSGFLMEIDFFFLEIEGYLGRPDQFRGFTCLTVMIKYDDYPKKNQVFNVYFEEDYEFRVSIISDRITDYVFSSGRMAVSPGLNAPDYMEYNYLTNTLVINATGGRLESYTLSAIENGKDKSVGFCSGILNEVYKQRNEFPPFSDIIRTGLHDIEIWVHNLFMESGPSMGHFWFWFIYSLIMCIPIVFLMVIWRNNISLSNAQWVIYIFLCVILPLLSAFILARSHDIIFTCPKFM
ncbi:MAG: hypothetical protein PVF83_11425 [Anaerolineales bacterium]|jgi:hypothetical protein